MAYLGSDNGQVSALDAATGEVRWTYAAEGDVNSRPVVVEGIVCFTNDQRVLALDADVEELLWTYEPGFGISSQPAAFDRLIVLGTGNKRVYALDVFTGEIRWSYRANSAVTSRPVVSDGIVRVTTGAQVAWLDAASGELLQAREPDRRGTKELSLIGGAGFFASTNVEEGVLVVEDDFGGAGMARRIQSKSSGCGPRAG